MVNFSLAGRAGSAQTASLADIMAMLQHGQVIQAEQSARQRLTQLPADARTWFALAACTFRIGRGAEATQHVHRAVALSPADPVLHSNCGKLLQDAGEVEASVELLHKAAQLDQANPVIRCNLAAALHQLGRFAEAVDAYRAALTLDPHCGQAYLGLAHCQRWQQAEEAPLSMLQQALTSCADAQARSAMHYAQAKIFDDLGQFDEAFGQALAANRIEAQRAPFDQLLLEQQVARRLQQQQAGWWAEHRPMGQASRLPILVVGMPRSGTSLVEQMLSCHPLIGGAGELSIWEAAEHAFQHGGGRLSAELVEMVATHAMAQLSAKAPGKAHVIDKMPDNFNYAGLFHACFPHGKIIHCRRHPLDTCLSIFFHKFTGDFAYAHTLEALDIYYRHYLRQVEHWRTHLPVGTWLDVDYEQLVADPAGEAQRMTTFLGVDYDEALLRPEDNPRPVLTSSAWQVRQPIYRTARGKWQRYEAQLAPLMGLLDLVSEGSSEKLASIHGSTGSPRTESSTCRSP